MRNVDGSGLRNTSVFPRGTGTAEDLLPTKGVPPTLAAPIVPPTPLAVTDSFEPPPAAAQPPTATPRQAVAAPAVATAKLPKTGNHFIDSVSAAAVATKKKYGVPASVTLAQAILESGWGKHHMGRANNYFGIKGKGPAGSVVVPTREYVHGRWITIHARFKAYHNVTESFVDHGKLLAKSGHYKAAMRHTRDANAFARALTGVYATAPHYGDKLIALMKKYNLYRFDR